MGTSRRLAVLGLAVLSLYLFWSGGGFAVLRADVEQRRMKNVVLLEPEPEAVSADPTPYPEPTPEPVPEPKRIAEADVGEEITVDVMRGPRFDEVRETTILGGLTIKNETGYSIDAGSVLLEGPSLRLPAEGPQILILHTHGSEAYTQAGLDRYEANDSYRTEDTRYNIVRVGDELAERLEAVGLHVLHDREIYDFPSYTGSYNRSGEAVERYLSEYPGIAVVFDVHRDALGADGVIYKTMAEEEGTVASQSMLLVGTDASGYLKVDVLEDFSSETVVTLSLYAWSPSLM